MPTQLRRPTKAPPPPPVPPPPLPPLPQAHPHHQHQHNHHQNQPAIHSSQTLLPTTATIINNHSHHQHHHPHQHQHHQQQQQHHHHHHHHHQQPQHHHQLDPCHSYRCRSPARSCYSLPRQYCGGGGGSSVNGGNGGGSEYGADTVYSMPSVAVNSPSSLVRSPTFQSCHSESGRSVTNCQSQCCCCSSNNNTHRASCCETLSAYSVCSQPVSSCYGSIHGLVDGPTPLSLSSNPSFSNNNNHHHNNINSIPQTNNSLQQHHHHNNNYNQHIHTNHYPPGGFNNSCIGSNCNTNNNNACIIKNHNYQTEVVCRPISTMSPMPTLKNTSTKPVEGRSRMKCNSFHYRRHIEQHVERIFKYLREREERRLGIEAEVATKKNKETIRDLLANKESRYLRSLRMKTRPDDFEFISGLGRGYIGNVCLVKRKTLDSKPQVFAMKQLKKSQVFQQNHIAHIMAERDILAEADNDWIVKLYYSFQDKDFLYFILEYVPGGDLMNLLSLKNVFPENWARFYIAEISLAVQFVHDMGFIHRDIKPDNILIDARGHIKLTDFGLCTGFRWTHDSKYYKEETINSKLMQMNNNNNNNNGFGYDDADFVQNEHGTITNALTQRHILHAREKRSLSLVGSPNYIAPEVLRQAFNIQESTDERLCDWWSVGVILYEMVIGYCPFIDLDKVRDHTWSPSNDPPQFIQQRIVNWKNYLRFPDMNDPKSPPLQREVINPRVHADHSQEVTYAEPKYIERETKDLIKGLLCDPKDRLNGLAEIKTHPFFESIADWQMINQTQAPYVPYLKDEHDTSHFSVEQFNILPTEPENQLGSTLTTPVNDFTYKSFWHK